MNKKILSMLVLGTITLQVGGVSVYAKDNIVQVKLIKENQKDNSNSIYTKDKIEKLVKEKLNLPDDLKLTYSNLEVQETKLKKIWRLIFESKDRYVSVGAYADTGEIINIDANDKNNYSNVVKLKEGEAKQKAVDFIKNIEPDKLNQVEEVQYNERTSFLYKTIAIYQDNNSYSFLYVRKFDNELMPSNYILVKVSGVTGKIVSYTYNWDEATYNNSSKTMSEDQARNIFEKQENLKLKYIRCYDNKITDLNDDTVKIPTLIPVYYYATKDSGDINATNGKLYKQDEIYNSSNYVGTYYENAMNNLAKDEKSKDADGIGKTETIPENGVISQEKAEEILKNSISKIKGIEFSDIKSQNSYYTKNSDIKIWSIYMQNKDGSKTLSGGVDALTGKITYINYGDYQGNALNKTEPSKDINKENVKKEVLNKLNPLLKFLEIGDNEIKLNMEDIPKKFNGVLSFKSSRYINDIPYDDNVVNISYNITTGKVTSLSVTWDKVNAKYSNNLVGKADAQKKYFDTVGFEKYLVQLVDKEKQEKYNVEVPLKEVVPVYSVKSCDFAYLSALDGSVLNVSGNKYDDSKNTNIKFEDIDNSKWKDEINFMNKMSKIQENNKKFNPDGVLLKKDAIKWIVNLGLSRQIDPLNDKTLPSYDESPVFNDLDKNDPYYTYAESAWRLGIIDKDDKNFNGNAVVTKIDVTRWIINGMGLRRLANSKILRTNDNVQNLGNNDIGYVALSEYYGLFDDTTFDASKKFNRDEFVGVLYHFLLKQN